MLVALLETRSVAAALESGVWCGSTYELIFVMYQLALGKEVKRCEQIRPYMFEGRIRPYYPDFEIEGVIYEIKGYFTPKDRVKRTSYPDIVWVERDEISG